MDDWQQRLDEVIADARGQVGDDALRAALEDALDQLDARRVDAPLTPFVAVLGVVPCAAGWLGVLVRPSGQTTVHVGSVLVSLVEQVREQEALGAVGLSDSSPRSSEVQSWIDMHPRVEIIDVGRQRSLDGITVPPLYSGMGFDENDLLEACGVAGSVAVRFC